MTQTEILPQKSQVLPRSGTLVVPVPCADGLVVCADKRTHDERNGVRDDTIKIHEVSGPGLFVHHGDTALVSGKTGEVLYDAVQTALDFFAEGTFTLGDNANWDGLARKLQRSFLDAVDRSEISTAPKDLDLGFVFGFFWFSAGAPKGALLRCIYRWEGQPRLLVRREWIAPDALSGKSAMAMGNTAVFNELRVGSDRRFDALREDPLMARFVRGSPACETSCLDARDYAKKLVGISSRDSHRLGTGSDISPTVDCALLKPDGVIIWLDENAQALADGD